MGVKPADLEQTIAQALKQQHILVEPSVSVSVLEYRSRPVNVVGAVRHSVTFQAMGDVKLLDAIAKADGLSPEAGPEILISSIGPQQRPLRQDQAYSGEATPLPGPIRRSTSRSMAVKKSVFRKQRSFTSQAT